MKRFELKEQDGITVIQLHLLNGVRHAFSTKKGGEAGALTALHLPPQQLLTMRQVHGAEVLIWKGGDSPGALPHRPIGDAAITDREGIALGIWTADCIPILMADQARGVIAAVHAGWRGVWRGIIPRTIRALQDTFGSKNGGILAGIGPGIAPCCYEVREDVVDLFCKDHDHCHLFIQERGGRSYLDLPSAARLQLMKMGIPPENIAEVSLCTACREDLFFSYRRDGSRGRQLSCIML